MSTEIKPYYKAFEENKEAWKLEVVISHFTPKVPLMKLTSESCLQSR